MTELQIEKLKRFANDPVMIEAVFRVITNSFFDRKGTKDVNVLAAERIALDVLREAERVIGIYKAKEFEESKKVDNPGL